LLTPPLAVGGQTTAPAATTPEPRFKRLTAAEMVAKRTGGECYNCTEKFTKEHLKVCPVKGIFLLQLDTSVADDPLDDTTPQISLNTITGISAAETMKLFVQLNPDTVTALVDSSSTHSFISTEVMCRLHLEPVFHPGLQVTITNGDKVASTGICHNVKFFIDAEAFVMSSSSFRWQAMRWYSTFSGCRPLVPSSGISPTLA
jgi:hypothetical protein